MGSRALMALLPVKFLRVKATAVLSPPCLLPL
jgi:hypothetical protein